MGRFTLCFWFKTSYRAYENELNMHENGLVGRRLFHLMVSHEGSFLHRDSSQLEVAYSTL